jgi:hypothetical protein
MFGEADIDAIGRQAAHQRRGRRIAANVAKLPELLRKERAAAAYYRVGTS